MEKYYLDTSVIGGVFDSEFRTSGRTFIEQIMLQGHRFVFSPLVEEEISYAPDEVRELYASLAAFTIIQPLDDAVLTLRDEYIEAGILTPKWQSDATHVAAATVSGCRAIISWNFRHIVHMDKIPMYNRVNMRFGY